MPRRTTILCPGKVFHICNRSAGQLTLFSDEYEYHLFERTFVEMLELYPLQVFAYCLMPNHWHLLVQSESPNLLSQALHWLETTHAIRWRKTTESTGRGAVYQSRFRAHSVCKNEAFLKVAHYIERNPVAAFLCRTAEDWRWSSAYPKKPATIKITDWPLPRPRNWSQILKIPLTKDWLAKIRLALTTQDDLGENKPA